MDRYIIALNQTMLKQKKRKGQKHIKVISNDEVFRLMNFVRKYPHQKIEYEKLYTYGFSKN